MIRGYPDREEWPGGRGNTNISVRNNGRGHRLGQTRSQTIKDRTGCFWLETELGLMSSRQTQPPLTPLRQDRATSTPPVLGFRNEAIIRTATATSRGGSISRGEFMKTAASHAHVPATRLSSEFTSRDRLHRLRRKLGEPRAKLELFWRKGV